jgi:hypothetical protein
VHPFGLGGETRRLSIAIADDASSVMHALPSAAGTEIEIRDLVEYLDEQRTRHVDLMKLNIEGAEYELLERVLGGGRAGMFGRILVQFHDELPDAEQRADAIGAALAETHELVWRVPFVWESWRLTELPALSARGRAAKRPLPS